MRRLALVAVAVIVAGCRSTSSPPTSAVTVHVANQAGVAMGGVKVRAQQYVTGSELRDLEPTTVTADDGTATLVLPVNVTASIGLSHAPGEEHWQQQIAVPPSDVTLSYQYPVPLDCAVVDPTSPTSCPPTPTPSP